MLEPSNSRSRSSPFEQCYALARQLGASENAGAARSIKAALLSLLARYLPSTDELLRILAVCSQGPAWKRAAAAEIAEYVIIHTCEVENPVSIGLLRTLRRLFRPRDESQTSFSIGVRAFTCVLVVVVLCPFWPFGLTYKAMMANLKHFRLARCGATYRASSGIDALSYVLEAAVYGLLVCIFCILSIPLFILIFLAEILGGAILLEESK